MRLFSIPAVEATDSVPDEAVADVAHQAGAVSISDAILAARDGDLEGLVSLGITIAVPAVIALLTLVVGYMVAKFMARVITGPVCKRVDETLGRFAGKFVFYSVMTCVVIGVASTVGINVTSFAAVLAAAGFAIGMAFQGTLGNFAAGILLLVFRPFKVGDVINAAGVTGKVNEIDLFTITLDTPDNRRLIVPNSSVAGNTIENISFHAHRRVDVVVGVTYSADIDATRQCLTEAVESLMHLMVRGEGRGFAVILTDLGSSSVNWVVRLWTPSPKFFEAKELLTATIKNKLDAAGIGIPFPQMDVHFDQFPSVELVPPPDEPGRVRPRLRSRAS